MRPFFLHLLKQFTNLHLSHLADLDSSGPTGYVGGTPTRNPVLNNGIAQLLRSGLALRVFEVLD
jgi:hypothetical protein